jgi:hypothetical protein
MSGWISPRLGIRFELAEDLTIYRPDGRPFETYLEIAQQRHRSDQIAEIERQRAEIERQRADRLAAKLRELGLNPDE